MKLSLRPISNLPPRGERAPLEQDHHDGDPSGRARRAPREFLDARGPAWDELDAIVAEAAKRGPKHLDPARLEAFLRLYRSTSADLARLRTLSVDGSVVDRVNRLVSRAHAVLYRAPKKSPSIGEFYRVTFPATFRRLWPFMFASVAVTVVFFSVAKAEVVSHPDVISDLVGGGDAEFSSTHQPGDFADRFQAAPSPLITSFVTTNNVGVALRAFAFGVSFGLGTLYVLVVNGAMLGGFAGAYAKAGLGHEFWFTVLPHGALELSAIAIAGGAGLALGFRLWSPGRRTRLAALRDEALRSVQIAAGLIPAFVVAGVFEGFVTPSHALAPGFKVGLGLAAACVFWVYLLLGGRRRGSVRLDGAPSAPSIAR